MEAKIVEILTLYAYNPMLVYAVLFAVMYASSFGLPIPEEFTLITTGFLVYMGMNPNLYPMPAGGTPLNVHVTAAVCFIAVFSSDLLVFMIGKKFGKRIIKIEFFTKVLSPERMDKIEKWANKYGKWACGIFRFTPGIRFPGHLSCGMAGLKTRTFVLVDGAMVLISVPTQIYAVAYFGNEILAWFKKFKLLLLACLVMFLVFKYGPVLFRRIFERMDKKSILVDPKAASKDGGVGDDDNKVSTKV